MAAGGLRRIEVPGAKPELSYARIRSERFFNELFGDGDKYKCAAGCTLTAKHTKARFDQWAGQVDAAV